MAYPVEGSARYRNKEVNPFDKDRCLGEHKCDAVENSYSHVILAKVGQLVCLPLLSGLAWTNIDKRLEIFHSYIPLVNEQARVLGYSTQYPSSGHEEWLHGVSARVLIDFGEVGITSATSPMAVFQRG